MSDTNRGKPGCIYQREREREKSAMHSLSQVADTASSKSGIFQDA